MKTFWYASKFVVLIIAMGVLAYCLLLHPQSKRCRTIADENSELETSMDSLHSQLKEMPTIEKTEKDLWQLIELRNQQILFDETNMIKALADLANLANRHGAELTAVSIEDSPPPDQQETNRTRNRRRDKQVKPEPIKVGKSTVKIYPVRLAVRGDYFAWTRMLTAMSQQFVPVILDKIDTMPAEDGPLMIVSLRVPARYGESPLTADASKPVAAVAYSDELGVRYRLDELESQRVAQFVSRDIDPFPVIVQAVLPRETLEQPDWALTAVIQRDGQYVAMINDHIMTVGDELEGRRLVQITPTAAIFKRVN